MTESSSSLSACELRLGSCIPNQGNAVGRLAEQIVEERNGAFGVACLRRLPETLLSVKVHSTVIGLPDSLVGDRNLNSFIRFTPDLPTQVPPQQVAFILEKHHLTRANLRPMPL